MDGGQSGVVSTLRSPRSSSFSLRFFFAKQAEQEVVQILVIPEWWGQKHDKSSCKPKWLFTLQPNLSADLRADFSLTSNFYCTKHSVEHKPPPRPKLQKVLIQVWWEESARRAPWTCPEVDVNSSINFLLINSKGNTNRRFPLMLVLTSLLDVLKF